MSGREDQSLTEAYLDFTGSGWSPSSMNDTVVTLDQWPAEYGRQTTLGYHERTPHDDIPPRVVVAARVAQLATITTLQAEGTEGAWGSANPALLARTKTWHNFLQDAFSDTPSAGDPTGFSMLVDFASNTTPWLRQATARPEALTVFRKNGSGDVKGVEAIAAIDDLVLRDRVSSLRAKSAQGVLNVLRRDLGVTSFGSDLWEVVTRWAVVRRMPSGVTPGHVAGQALGGRFLSACWAVKYQAPPLDDDEEKEDYLRKRVGPAIYRDYRRLLDEGVIPRSSVPVGFRRFDLANLEQQKRTAEEARRVIAVAGPTRAVVSLTQKPHALTLRTFHQDGLEATLPELRRAIATDPRSLTELRLLAAAATQAGVQDCRDHRTRVEEVRARITNIKKNILPRIYADYPYLDPGHLGEMDAGAEAYEQLAPYPADAVGYLQRYDTEWRHRGRGGFSNVPEALTAFAAASMGSEADRRAAASTINLARHLLQQRVGALIPVLANPGATLRAIPEREMQERYGITAAEVESLDIPTHSLGSELPLDLYTVAALAIIDRNDPDSLFPLVRRSPSILAFERVDSKIRAKVPFLYPNIPAEDIADMAKQQDQIASYLHGEATQYYSDDELREDDRGAIEYAVMPNKNEAVAGRFANLAAERFANLLVACRLADAHASIAAEYPRYHQTIALRLGPILARAQASHVRGLPEKARRTYNRYFRLYRQLTAPDRRAS